MQKVGILLVNLGTPDSPHPKDVHRYLIEFLTDPRVIDSQWLMRQLLVRGLIVPARYKQSAKCYQKIWTLEGSPLMVYSKKVRNTLQKWMGDDFYIELGMRYQHPSIAEGLEKLLEKEIQHLIILPLFPQYAAATTGSVQQKILELLSQYSLLPKVTLIDQFSTHPAFIEAFGSIARKYPLTDYDHCVFSFHGLPQKHLKKANRHQWCTHENDCCHRIQSENQGCYAAQCYATAQAITTHLNIPKDQYTIAFQSRLGKDPWLEPYTIDTLKKLVDLGKKRVLVFCPSFVCDCLETLYEIGIEYKQEFLHYGGEKLDLVEGLNDHPQWIKALVTIIQENLASKTPSKDLVEEKEMFIDNNSRNLKIKTL